MITDQFVNIYAGGKTVVSARPVAAHSPTAAADEVRRIVHTIAAYELGVAEMPDYEVFAFREQAEDAAILGPVPSRGPR
ncbi:MAG TPA: hypothetical protein VHU81_21080 [Thermoanaerobaculia bacterium]|jgi:hypothetical protein|nr:hypothetical protein [Thermoanaerobaculia bacterium]